MRTGAAPLGWLRSMVGGSAFVVLWWCYKSFWLDRWSRSGRLESQLQAIAHGRAPAPYQYRVLVPRLELALGSRWPFGLEAAVLLFDGAGLLAGALLLFALLRRAGAGRAIPAASVYVAAWGIAACWWAKPETFAVFAAASAVVLVFLHGRSEWSLAVLVVATIVLAGDRTDVLFALGVAFGLRWCWRRSVRDLRIAAALIGAAVLATVALRAAYPGAHYPDGIALVQIGWNLQPRHFLVPIGFLLPLLLPLTLGRWRGLRVDDLALLVSFAIYCALTLVVGRIEEVRMIFPFAGLVAVLTVQMWTALAGGQSEAADRAAGVPIRP